MKVAVMAAVAVAMVAVVNAAKVPMVKSVPRVKAVAVAKPAVKAEVKAEVKDALKGVRVAPNCATVPSAPPVIAHLAKAVARVATTTALRRTKVVQKPNPS